VLARLGLGAKLAIAFAGLAAFTALVTAGVSAYSTSRQVNADVDRFLQTRSLDISEGRRANSDRPRGNRPRLGSVANEVRELVESDAEVQLLDQQGRIVLSSGAVLPVEAIDLAVANRERQSELRTIQIDGESYRIVTRRTEGGGAVQVAKSLSTTNDLLGDLRNELILVGLAMSALAAAIGWSIAQSTTRPLRRLTQQVEAVAETKDLSTPVALDRSDEIGRLSEEFDQLLKTLGASQDQQQRLVQDAAHELRTPLTSVRANIDFLERAADLDPAERQSTLRSIKAELHELSSVLAEVVELATDDRPSTSFEPVDLAIVAESALAQFELRSTRTVVRELSSSVVAGDVATLTRAATNLLANAHKYSPDDLPITVGVSNGDLWVADHGPGIAEDERERVFDRFYRSDGDRSAPGSGLGLAIVAKAARAHGGEPWVRTTRGGGATVGFSLPVS